VDKQTAKIQKRLAKNVVALRHQLGWTQEECANELEVATAYLSRVERAVVNVTLKNLVKLATGFDIDISELLKP
jgi:transcriptional regulator with XRE-family HTH domain